jgi:hypothetical protein
MRPAASRLNVRPSTLAKVFAGNPLSSITWKKLIPVLGRRAPALSTRDREASAFRRTFSLLQERLQAMMAKNGDLLPAAVWLGVYPSTIQKILRRKPLSYGVRKKIRTAFENGGARRRLNARQAKRVQQLLEIHRLYLENGSLRIVARKVGYSQERVRYLLVRGTRLGLFAYKPKARPPQPRLLKRKLLDDYRRLLSLGAIAKENKISGVLLRKLLSLYRIEKRELRAIQIKERKQKCIAQYHRIQNRLGDHPNTTELQRSRFGKNLSMRILTLWGSFDAFRKELSSPKTGAPYRKKEKYRSY